MSSKLLQEFTRGKKPDHWRICYDAQTPTEDLLMCKHPHPKLNNLYLAVGGSFHSYKSVYEHTRPTYMARLTCDCRFMPVAGKYFINILNGESNGDEKDKAWGWKTDADWNDVREFGLLSGKAVAKSEVPHRHLCNTLQSCWISCGGQRPWCSAEHEILQRLHN